MTFKRPVFGAHLKYFGQFIYTGDYAVETSDLISFPIDRKLKSDGCMNCMDHLRLLTFHVTLFFAARYLGMKKLQMLAMSRFTAAMEHATPTVLRYIVQSVYEHVPKTPMVLHTSLYSLSGWSDYRPLLVLPAIMNHIRHHYPAIEPLYDGMVHSPHGVRAGKVYAGWAETDAFLEVRRKFPDFDQHLRWAEAQLAQENANAQLKELDKLDLDNLVSEAFQEQRPKMDFEEAIATLEKHGEKRSLERYRYRREVEKELRNNVAKFKGLLDSTLQVKIEKE